jgi:hypothetical protein
MGVRQATLDKLVGAHRKASDDGGRQGRALRLLSPEPWPTPVHGSVAVCRPSPQFSTRERDLNSALRLGISRAPKRVRFAPDSRHRADMPACRKRANSSPARPFACEASSGCARSRLSAERTRATDCYNAGMTTDTPAQATFRTAWVTFPRASP